MPALALFLFCFWALPYAACQTASAAEASAPDRPAPEGKAIHVIHTTAEIPDGDLRRMRLPWLRRKDTLTVEFRVETQPENEGNGGQAEDRPVLIEILRRERSWFGRVHHRRFRSVPAEGQGEFEWRAPEDGDYLVALSKAGNAGRPARVSLDVSLRRRQELTVTRVSTLGRLAALFISLAFLTQMLSSFGLPIIEAFRARKRPPSPPWFG